MNDIEQAQTLLRIAYRDFNALQGMTDSPLFADEIFGFHAQQAIEKALKAWLCAKNLIYPLSHELPRLLTLLENNGAHIDAFWPLARFTPYAVQSRYEEGSVYETEPLNRSAIIGEVEVLLNQVTRFIASIENQADQP